MRIKKFNEMVNENHYKPMLSDDELDRLQKNRFLKMGRYDMSNGNMELLLDDLKLLKESYGNYISFHFEYDEYRNFLTIENMTDDSLEKIVECVKNRGGYKFEDDDDSDDDALSILPMTVH